MQMPYVQLIGSKTILLVNTCNNFIKEILV